jgi:hypothetical protein
MKLAAPEDDLLGSKLVVLYVLYMLINNCVEGGICVC